MSGAKKNSRALRNRISQRAAGKELLEIALVENLQRQDLNPLEEAQAFRGLSDEFGMTQEQIAARVGRSRTAVANTLRLLSLEDDIRALALSRGIKEVAFGDVLLQFPNDDTLSFGEWFGGVKTNKPHWLEDKPAVAGDELYSIGAKTAYLKQHGVAATIVHLAKFGLKLGNIKRDKAAASSESSNVKEVV